MTFFYLLDHFCLRKSPRQRRHYVNVVSNTANMHGLGSEVAADCRQITVHARLHV